MWRAGNTLRSPGCGDNVPAQTQKRKQSVCVCVCVCVCLSSNSYQSQINYIMVLDLTIKPYLPAGHQSHLLPAAHCVCVCVFVCVSVCVCVCVCACECVRG